jgi:hypothetical protein
VDRRRLEGQGKLAKLSIQPLNSLLKNPNSQRLYCIPTFQESINLLIAIFEVKAPTQLRFKSIAKLPPINQTHSSAISIKTFLSNIDNIPQEKSKEIKIPHPKILHNFPPSSNIKEALSLARRSSFSECWLLVRSNKFSHGSIAEFLLIPAAAFIEMILSKIFAASKQKGACFVNGFSINSQTIICA